MFDHQDDYNQCRPAELTEGLKIWWGEGAKSIIQGLLLLIWLKKLSPPAPNSVPTVLFTVVVASSEKKEEKTMYY